MTRSSFGLAVVALGVSSALHGVAYAALPRGATVVMGEQPSQVAIEIGPGRTPIPPAPEPEPLKPSPEPIRPEPAVRVSRAPEAARTPEPDRAPVDLRGVTLTSDGDAAFAARLGDGSRLDGPLRAPAPPAGERRRRRAFAESSGARASTRRGGRSLRGPSRRSWAPRCATTIPPTPSVRGSGDQPAFARVSSRMGEWARSTCWARAIQVLARPAVARSPVRAGARLAIAMDAR